MHTPDGPSLSLPAGPTLSLLQAVRVTGDPSIFYSLVSEVGLAVGRHTVGAQEMFAEWMRGVSGMAGGQVEQGWGKRRREALTLS